MIKSFIIVLLGLFTVITAMSLLIPSKVMTAKAIVIHAPKQKIVEALTDFGYWKQWNPIFSKDTVKILVSNPSSGHNAYSSWGENDKKNKFTITEVLPEGIKFILARPGENDVENSIIVMSLKDSGSCQVEWKALTLLNWYPWEKFAGIFVSEITGPSYESALTGLKSFVESNSP